MPSSDLIPNAPNLNHAWTALMAEELARLGVKHVFVSPGSRSTPLTLAVARHPALQVHMHFDERGAAFAALGCGLATGKAAGLICTSGSAVANYLPAVVEAAQSHVPLLILTADRPPELLDCGANQAILQPGIFGAYVRWEASTPCPDAAVPPSYVLSTIDQAIHRTQWPYGGPVHLNCAFREPLAPTAAAWDTAWLAPIANWLAGDNPHTSYHGTVQSLDEDAQEFLHACVTANQNGLLVIGSLQDEAAQRAAAELAAQSPWPVFATLTSGLRTHTAPRMIASHDLILLHDAVAAEYRPDFVLHIGGPIVSKRLATQLAAWRRDGVTMLHVADHPRRQDPDHGCAHRFTAAIPGFCTWLTAIVRALPAASSAEGLLAQDRAVKDVLNQVLDGTDEITEMAIARRISRLRPAHTGLFAANSMPVRDLDLFAAPDGSPGPVYANRGASGIDGNIATVAGIARGSGAPWCALVGDLAALHDLNSLALLRNLETPLVLVIINNDGGGIFSFLPVAESTPHFEELFGTPHGLGFEAAAALFGLGYAAPKTLAGFSARFEAAIKQNGTTILEVRTDRAENLAAHQVLQAQIKAALKNLSSNQ